MPQRKVLAIGLDGYEQSVGDSFMKDGSLPALAALRDRSARFLLDHGAATRTGLAWEHASSGRSPADGGRGSAVHFDRDSYEIWHEGTSLPPFPASLRARTVIFDPPYFDLQRAPSARGVMNWGAHDPGVAFGARPAELADEIRERFGPYPVQERMYEIVWPSLERTREVGELLVRGTQVRARAAQWLLRERCPEWDLGFVVISELHSAIEAFWHGIDAAHPLHSLPSGAESARQLLAAYQAADSLVGELVSAFPEALVVAFAINGMGPNLSDCASMVLLPELLHRSAFGQPLLRVPAAWANAPGGVPILDEEVDWTQAVKTHITQLPGVLDLARRAAVRVLPERVRRALRPQSTCEPATMPDGTLRLPLDWMPTILYQPYWNAMRYFALPSFYDGRIRINLAGREAQGMVAQTEYAKVCDEIEALVRTCRDLRTGEPVVDHVERCSGDPLTIGPADSDLIVVWRGATLGFAHPTAGNIGPLPFRRTGGHTGPYGMAYIAGDGIASGDYGVRPSFDVVPTIIELLGEESSSQVSGSSFCSLLAKC